MSFTKAKLAADFTQSLVMVKEFHEVFGHPVGVIERETLPEGRACERASYLLEELQEGLVAALGKNKVKTVDALADAVYFSCGNLVECGTHTSSAISWLDDILRDEEDAKMSFESMKEEVEEYGWSRYFRNVFISSLSEVATQHHDGLGGADKEEDIAVVTFSTELALCYLALMKMAFDVDPLAIMQEVHRSNMSKLLPAELDSEDACRVFMISNGCPLSADELKFERLDDMRWIAKNISTNKVVKNPLYSEPDLIPLIP